MSDEVKFETEKVGEVVIGKGGGEVPPEPTIPMLAIKSDTDAILDAVKELTTSIVTLRKEWDIFRKAGKF